MKRLTEETIYTYDANGSQLTKTTDEKTEINTYNAVNQLVGFTDGETTASYTYNADGLRASKTVDGETVKHVWDGAKQIIADVKNGAFYEADCYIRGTNLVAKYNYVNGAKSEYTYYTQNAHGDVVNLTDTDGIVIKTYKYDAFGVEKNIDDADTNAFRYCGEYYDSETGTIYLRARHYNPSNGRFTQRDSFAGKQGDPLSLNLYTYCHNNPVYYSDPSGNFAIALPALALAAAAVVVVSTTAIVVSNNPQAQQSFNEMTYDVERGFKDLVDSSKRVLNKVKTWGKSLTAKAKNTYETAKTVATVAGTSIIASTIASTAKTFDWINQFSQVKKVKKRLTKQ